MKIVYEYILDENNNILTIQQWNDKEKPELKDNPIPTDNMLQGILYDEFLNPLYKLINNEIIGNNIQLTDEQDILKKINNKNISDIIRILIKGIENPADVEYIALKAEILGSEVKK